MTRAPLPAARPLALGSDEGLGLSASLVWEDLELSGEVLADIVAAFDARGDLLPLSPLRAFSDHTWISRSPTPSMDAPVPVHVLDLVSPPEAIIDFARECAPWRRALVS